LVGRRCPGLAAEPLSLQAGERYAIEAYIACFPKCLRQTVLEMKSACEPNSSPTALEIAIVDPNYKSYCRFSAAKAPIMDPAWRNFIIK
jgi:hypothetical protein